MNIVTVSNLTATVGDTQVLSNVDLELQQGSTLFLLGPNGSGKSSLTHVLMGHPDYTVTSGKVSIADEDMEKLATHERARKGLFLAFQQPMSLPGVALYELLLASYTSQTGNKGSKNEFQERLENALELLGLQKSFVERSANDGMSGGEKKKAEMLQMLILQPRVAIVDEIDSGLDVDALKLIAATLSFLQKKGTSFIVITHYNNLLEYIAPDQVVVLKNGTIIARGDHELAQRIQREGFNAL